MNCKLTQEKLVPIAVTEVSRSCQVYKEQRRIEMLNKDADLTAKTEYK